MILRSIVRAASVPILWSSSVRRNCFDALAIRAYGEWMRKILILDEDTPFREALVAQIRETARAEVVLATDDAELVTKIQNDDWAAVLVDTSLVGELPRVLGAVNGASWRPLVLLVTQHPNDDLDPELISLVIRKPYEVGMVTGILLAAVTDVPDRIAQRGDALPVQPPAIAPRPPSSGSRTDS